MTIADTADAARFLQRVGYYRLSGYWYPMRESQQFQQPNGQLRTVIAENFRPGTTFDQAKSLYIFDKKLRLLMLDAIERVEVGLKVQIAQILGQRNPIAHLDPNELHGNFSRRNARGFTKYDDWLQKYQKNEYRSKEDFIVPFLTKHPGEEFPIWMAIEFWDFGNLSHFFAGMKVQDQHRVAAVYGLNRHDLIVGWVRGINVVRNTCAHHSRLWNRPLADNPSPPRRGDSPLLDHLVGDVHAQTRLYTVAIALQFLIRTMHPNSTWGARLSTLCNTLPQAPNIDIKQAGFPQNWESMQIWR